MSNYIGVVCDMAAIDQKPYMTRAECNDCVQYSDHPCPFNGKVMRMMWGDDDHEPDGLTFSPTRIQGCRRAKYYERERAPQILDPYKKWNAIRGTMAHSLLEGNRSGPGVLFDIPEERMTIQVDTKYGPQRFTGKPDLIEVIGNTDRLLTVKITDWKSTKDIPHDMLAAKPEHVMQVNMYAYLCQEYLPTMLNRPGLKVLVSELEIVYFTMGKSRRFTSKCDLTDRGKLLRPFSAGQYEYITLSAIEHHDQYYIKNYIRANIEAVIEAQDHLAPRLEGDNAKLCPYCPFYKHCYEEGTDE